MAQLCLFLLTSIPLCKYTLALPYLPIFLSCMHPRKKNEGPYYWKSKKSERWAFSLSMSLLLLVLSLHSPTLLVAMKSRSSFLVAPSYGLRVSKQESSLAVLSNLSSVSWWVLFCSASLGSRWTIKIFLLSIPIRDKGYEKAVHFKQGWDPTVLYSTQLKTRTNHGLTF